MKTQTYLILMNKLLTVIFLMPLASLGQDINLNVDKKVEITEKKDAKAGMGLNYKGSGVYTLAKGSTSIGSKSKSRLAKVHLETKNQILQEIKEFTIRNNYDYKITLVENLGTIWPMVVVTFQVFNKDGSLVLNKEDAKNKLVELKEYLDLGIITQDEYNKTAVSLKKILLGN